MCVYRSISKCVHNFTWEIASLIYIFYTAWKILHLITFPEVTTTLINQTTFSYLTAVPNAYSFKAFVQQPWFIKQLGWKIVMYIIHTFLLMACMQSGNVMIWKTISPFSLVLCRRQQRHHGQWGPWNCIRTFQWYPSWWLTVLVLCSVWIIFLNHGMSVVYNDLFTRSIVLDIRDMSIAFLLII